MKVVTEDDVSSWRTIKISSVILRLMKSGGRYIWAFGLGEFARLGQDRLGHGYFQLADLHIWSAFNLAIAVTLQ